METVDAMIPVWRPDSRLDRCVEMLREQSYKIRRITLILSVDQGDDAWVRRIEARFWGKSSIYIKKINKKYFNHGGTRHMWASQSDADILLFMVQDAVPGDKRLVERLVQALEKPQNAVVYARHIPDGRCDAIEAYARYFTYPPKSRVKRWEDVERMGVTGCFTSNVCAAYRRDWYEKVGGFERKILLSEDSVFAARALKSGAAAVYLAEARVVHAHHFSFLTQWRRNFDIGVVHRMYKDIFGGTCPEAAGAKLLAGTAAYLAETGKLWLFPKLFILGGIKAAAYQAGKRYQKLPKRLVECWSLDKVYWKET